ncbi:MAG TPA: hypothetical protein VE155_08145, partial [Pseudonocardiaceae bacterium]|nr:hypothetical protein [Pseudonocardiaceae bacterium]
SSLVALIDSLRVGRINARPIRSTYLWRPSNQPVADSPRIGPDSCVDPVVSLRVDAEAVMTVTVTVNEWQTVSHG